MIALMGATALAACSRRPTPAPTRRNDVEIVRYGDDAAQLAELSRPAGASRGVVVVIHGGFWRAQYDLSLGRPLAASLVDEGWTAYNLEYRRVGNGGGWPATFDDVAAGIDALAGLDVDTSAVVTLGHSAGGHLAVWAAGRAQLAGSAWSRPLVPVTAAVSQAGVVDLAAAAAANLGDGAVPGFLRAADGTSGPYDLADPMAQLPLDVPVRCVHGTDDQVVPIAQSRTYVDAARAAGADARLVEVDGDHFVVIDPRSDAWARTLEVLAPLGA
jgi:acetyl esterase/lipase